MLDRQSEGQDRLRSRRAHHARRLGERPPRIHQVVHQQDRTLVRAQSLTKVGADPEASEHPRQAERAIAPRLPGGAAPDEIEDSQEGEPSDAGDPFGQRPGEPGSPP